MWEHIARARRQAAEGKEIHLLLIPDGGLIVRALKQSVEYSSHSLRVYAPASAARVGGTVEDGSESHG